VTERRLVRPTALKRLKDTYRDKGVLLPAMSRHVMKSAGDDPERSTTCMHPSDMCKPDWCGRHDFYRIVGNPVEKSSARNPSFRMENVFAEGHAIHGKYQTWLWEMGVLFGDWQCLECGHRFGALSPDHCQFCLSKRIIYKELPVEHRNFMVEGHSDAAVHAPWWRGLVEIKSIGVNTWRFEAPMLWNRYQAGESAENIWMSINRPFSSHLRQGQFYLWMTWPRYEEILFIYESKFHQQTKEFLVGYNKSLIAPILEEARDVAYAVRKETPPPRPSWAEDPVSKICQGCEYRKTCWNMGKKSGKTVQEAPTVIVSKVTSAKRKRALRKA
jgi:hypothetical protein